MATLLLTGGAPLPLLVRARRVGSPGCFFFATGWVGAHPVASLWLIRPPSSPEVTSAKAAATLMMSAPDGAM